MLRCQQHWQTIFPQFDDNLTDDAVVVFEGTSNGSLPSYTGLDGFSHPGIVLTSLFSYDPASGRNLVIELASESVTDRPWGSIDRQSTVNLRTLTASGANAENGSIGRSVAVRQFSFVPEPSTITMLPFLVFYLVNASHRRSNGCRN